MSADPLCNIITALISGLSGIAAIISFFWGLHTYRQDKILKGKDIIFPLMEEFDNSKEMKLACLLLPDKPVELIEDPNVDSDKKKIYWRKDLKYILRYHVDVGSFKPAEKEIRESFDKLLNFLYKLEYLLTIRLINDKEVEYFRFYIDLICDDANKAVIDYVKAYKFPFVGRLNRKLSWRNKLDKS